MRPALLTRVLAFVAGVVLPSMSLSGAVPWWVEQDSSGSLIYRQDEQGNRVPDFSHCGYMGGNRPIPTAPVRVVVTPAAGDQTARLQAAIDYVASLPADANGIKGAVLLRKGTYDVASQLRITSSGVVLRGEGMHNTTIRATGYDRRMLIRVLGKSDMTRESPIDIIDDYVPVGAYTFSVADASSLSAGDTILITRPSNAAWLAAIGMDGESSGMLPRWRPGSRDIVWDRVIKSIDGSRITVDAPITTAIESRFGGATVAKYDWPGRISHVGIENLALDTTFDPNNPAGEAHAWVGITMENVENAWVRQVAFTHFPGGAVHILETCKYVTVEDSKSANPVGHIGGFRRHTFLTGGQMTLFLRCWSENGRHDFTTWHGAAGPNAFVWCQAYQAHDDSGPMFSWASGVLFDNVKIDGARLTLGNRFMKNAGVGWAAANSVLWNCIASEVECWNPPTARNWATGIWARCLGDGEWGVTDSYVSPQSLFQQQLAERLGPDAAGRAYGVRFTPGGTSPTYQQAEEMVAFSSAPAERVIDLINRAGTINPISIAAGDATNIDEILKANPQLVKSTPVRTPQPLELRNGWLTIDGRIAFGSRTNTIWWRGSVPPTLEDIGRYGITRFVPGRIGPGYTDDLDQMTDAMLSRGQIIMDYHPPLWQDRRRDDHLRVRRMDSNVWPPFYEMPFARSGKGTAWDGLSKFDLTKYDKWYWLRLREFAEHCDTKGLVLFHHNYFQHNILEAGAHWSDFPWRSANNINNTGFPEPPPYAGDKRIFQAHLFYDVNHPVRRQLHRAYIRQCLDAFAGNTNVIQMTSGSFTGPLHFMQFWLDVIAEWKKETGRRPLIALSGTKDVQDAILADPVRSKLIDVIDIRYWHYQADGTLYAPEGGRNLAPRQHARILRPRPSSFEQVARAVNEYRSRYPGKAVIYSVDGADPLAVLMAGGSLTGAIGLDNPELLKAITAMQPVDLARTGGVLVLAEPGRQYLVLCQDGRAAVDLSAAKRTYSLKWVDPQSGMMTDGGTIEGGSREVELKSPSSRTALAWLVGK